MSLVAEQAAFVISIDTELAWGSVHSGAFRSRDELFQRTREAIDRLIDLLERYQIHATWAIVGHLFLESCREVDGVKHPEIVRPDYEWFSGDWFDSDPGTCLQENPSWYGTDIIDQIKKCKVSQEIGSHGFSHMIIGDQDCSRECFDSEMKACVNHAEAKDLSLKSFVYPRNSVGHLDVLAANGFNAYRGSAPAWFMRTPARVQRWARLIDFLLPVAPPVVTPRYSDGLWDIPASYFYPHRDGMFKYVPTMLGVRKSKAGIDKAVKKGQIFHLWFHAFNLASDPDSLLQGLETIFQKVCDLRDAGKLTNPTMGDLAAVLAAGTSESVSDEGALVASSEIGQLRG